MTSRRDSLTALLAAPFAALAAARAMAQAAPRASSAPPPSAAPSILATAPRDNFHITGTYLNAAYTHPLPLDAAAAMRDWAAMRADPGARPDRAPDAKALFARLIGAEPAEIAAIPSTSYGESFVLGALGLRSGGRGKVVTDILHFDGSLYTYGELGKQGLDVVILPMTPEGRIDMNRLEAAVDGDTRLVAISLVSMVNGFEHDLKQVCAIAHRKGAKVYVDAVQGLGAVPLDVKASGVDFLACSTFKWLMGDFGYGFLYVRADLLPELKRPEYGYHQPKTLAYHALPGDKPGPVLFEATPDNGTAAGYFEVGSLGTAAQIAAATSLRNILAVGVEELQRRRQPLIERVRQAFSGRYPPLTPPDSRSGIIAFALPGARQALRPRLQAAGVNIQVYENRFRVSPSVYNTLDDVERLIEVIAPKGQA